MKVIDEIKKKINKEDIPREDDYLERPIYTNLDDNIKYIKTLLGDSFDLVSRDFKLKSDTKEIKLAFFYINGMVKQEYVDETVIESISKNFTRLYEKNKKKIYLDEVTFKEYLINTGEVKDAIKYGKLINAILSGDTVLLVDGFERYFIFGTRDVNSRAVSEPSTHISVVGPKDSFNENIITNMTLVRKRIKSPDLWAKHFIIGDQTNTDVALMYIKDVADQELIDEATKRLQSIKAKGILDSSYIINLIRDKNFGLFPTLYPTERPDVVCANLLEGRIAILVDGTPFAVLAPAVFHQFFHSVADYYHKAYIATFYRIIRTVGFYISLLLPALYVTLTSMHSELVPFELLIAISSQRQGIPFPAYIEVLILTLIYDVLREAGTRMPNALGSAISIVGALVLGEAAVQAGVVSPIMVMVVAGSAISTLVIPNYNVQLSTTILKYVFIVLATFFGFLGVNIGLIILHLHLASIRSFGVSYLTPFAPFTLQGIKDSIIRVPMKFLFKEPEEFNDKYPY